NIPLPDPFNCKFPSTRCRVLAPRFVLFQPSTRVGEDIILEEHCRARGWNSVKTSSSKNTEFEKMMASNGGFIRCLV
ncbi:hypothetical protein LINPERPRIM_LOCUS44218, partial [Linum perenne]